MEAKSKAVGQTLPASLSQSREKKAIGQQGDKIEVQPILRMWQARCRTCQHKSCLNLFGDGNCTSCEECQAEKEKKHDKEEHQR